MQHHVAAAADIDIPRPATPTGWFLLIFAVAVFLLIVNQGVDSIVGMVFKPLKATVIFFAVLLVIVVVAANESGWGADPVGRVKLLPTDSGNPPASSPVGGVATNSPAADGLDPTHSGDPNHHGD